MKSVLLGFLIFLHPGVVRATEELQSILVKPGDTLWSISSIYLKDPKRWSELLKHNRLPASDPSIALPGMALKVPVSLLKEKYRAAKLVNFLNDVLFRRAGASDWQGVRMSMDLFNNDTLRTRLDSRADVKFYTGEVLTLSPNTIAVLRPPGKKSADVEILAGELRRVRARVVTRSAVIMPKTGDTEFSARLKDDLTTAVEVTRGVVDVEAQGKKVEVREGFGLEVKMDMPPSPPVKLANLPALEPDGAAAVEPGKAWKKQGDGPGAARAKVVRKTVKGFHLQVSKDRAFTGKVLDKTYAAAEKIELNELLPPGEYFVRVALIDLLGFEGRFSAGRLIKVSDRSSKPTSSGVDPLGETSIYDFNYNNIGRGRSE
jgi:hypothetical protein